MGRVGVFRIAGLSLWFNSQDHLPPHFHAEKSGEWEVRVYFLRARNAMVDPCWARRKAPANRALERLLTLTERHRHDLLQEWERKVNPSAPGSPE